MERKPINALLVEDNPDYAAFLRQMITHAGRTPIHLHALRTLAEALEWVQKNPPEVILLSLSLPDVAGLEAYRLLQPRVPYVPIIVIGRRNDPDLARQAVHEGAQDYLVKGRDDCNRCQMLVREMINSMERAQAKTALLQAEDKYRSIFENAVEGIFQTTPDGHYLSANPALVRLYGYSSEKELKDAHADLGVSLYVDPHRRAEFIAIMQRDGKVTDFVSEIRCRGGRTIWISEKAREVRDPRTQTLLYYEGMVEDVTLRKASDEAIRFSEARFRSVWQYSNDGMRLTDEHGVIIDVNPAYCRIVDLKPEELLRQEFTVVYAEGPKRKEMLEHYQQRVREGTIEEQMERKTKYRSGREVNLQFSSALIRLDDRQVVLSIFRDITLRRRAEAELARSREELRVKNDIMQEDLRMAREIQMTLMPQPQKYPVFPRGATRETSRLRFCHRYEPASEVGGDFFDFLQLSDTKAGIFICDVMGHGVRSALVTAMIRALVEELRPIAHDPGQLITRFNGDLSSILEQAGTTTNIFTTAFYALVDLKERQVLFSNAGHPAPFLVHRLSGKVELLKHEGGKARPALGFFKEMTYPTSSRPLEPGDVLMLFTDGLFEVETPDGAQYSQQMLLAAAQRHAAQHCPELFDTIFKEIQGFSQNTTFTDDVCLVGVEVAEDF